MSTHRVKSRRYMIDLHKWRSAVALVACIVTLVLSISAITSNLIKYVDSGLGIRDLLQYFTIQSNLMTALASSFIIPYAINGIRRKRFVYPKWLSMFHYSGTLCTTLTMVFALLFILPHDRDLAIGAHNFFLHVICPIGILISFCMVESSYKYTRRDNLICLLPVLVYSLVYLTMVVIIGEERGGWRDLYLLDEFIPWYISLFLMYTLAYGIGYLIRKVSNQLTVKRQEELLSSWRPDLEKVELNVELFGLGRYYGMTCAKNDVSIPFDLLEMLADRYSLDPDDLVKVYVKGLVDGIRDRETAENMKADGFLEKEDKFEKEETEVREEK